MSGAAHGRRGTARVAAVQALYQIEFTRATPSAVIEETPADGIVPRLGDLLLLEPRESERLAVAPAVRDRAASIPLPPEVERAVHASGIAWFSSLGVETPVSTDDLCRAGSTRCRRAGRRRPRCPAAPGRAPLVLDGTGANGAIGPVSVPALRETARAIETRSHSRPGGRRLRRRVGCSS